MKFKKAKLQALHLGRNNPLHAGGSPAEEQPNRKGPGGPSEQKVDYKPAMCPCSKGQQLPRLR